jgi:hypothetical protein
MGLVVGDDPAAVVEGPAREPHGDAGGDPEHPQHHRHRPGVVLAVAGLRPGHELDERGARHARRLLVVREASALPEPGLERQNCRVRRAGTPGDVLCGVVQPLVGREVRIRRVVEDRARCYLAPTNAEGGEVVSVDDEEPLRPLGIPGWRAREHGWRGVRRVAPDAIAPAPVERIADAEDAPGEQEHRSQLA